MKNNVLSSSELKIVQEITAVVLSEFDAICKKNDIKYTLGYGTLIGAIRHKGFIPWDDDIDVCVKRSDLYRLREICVNDRELSDKLFYQTHDTDSEWFRLYDKIRVNHTVFKELEYVKYNMHQGIYIDIFPIDNIPNTKILQELHYFLFCIFSYALSAKYADIDSRKGINKIFARVLRFLSMPFSMDFLYRVSDKIATRYNGTNYCRIFNTPYSHKEVIPSKVYENYIEVEFDEMKVSAIRDYDYVLSKLYGDYMKLPPKNKRVAHHKIAEFEVDVGVKDLKMLKD